MKQKTLFLFLKKFIFWPKSRNSLSISLALGFIFVFHFSAYGQAASVSVAESIGVPAGTVVAANEKLSQKDKQKKRRAMRKEIKKICRVERKLKGAAYRKCLLELEKEKQLR